MLKLGRLKMKGKEIIKGGIKMKAKDLTEKTFEKLLNRVKVEELRIGESLELSYLNPAIEDDGKVAEIIIHGPECEVERIKSIIEHRFEGFGFYARYLEMQNENSGMAGYKQNYETISDKSIEAGWAVELKLN